MIFPYFTYTNPGGRPNNEDCVRVNTENARSVFVLADGLGGHAFGEVASATAAQSLAETCCSCGALDNDVLARQFELANEALLRRQREPGKGDMKTTAVALSLEGDSARWGHVGDSRLYRFSGGRVSCLTADHSVSFRKYLAGEIPFSAIPGDPDRPSLLRVLGRQRCRADAASCAAAPGDAFLLCSDGLWEYVSATEMLVDLLQSAAPEDWAKRILMRHGRAAPDTCDNFSLIAVFVREG